MADLLEYLERKQPQVGKKPQGLDYPGVMVQVIAHRH